MHNKPLLPGDWAWQEGGQHPLLALLLCAYTGAGISTSSGISDYATKSSKTLRERKHLRSPMLAQPTLAHRVLTAMYMKGFLKHWVQQNHDGLPQKAGYPQHALNE